jgi:hypothetical protein
VIVRPIRPADRDALSRPFDGLSEQSRYRDAAWVPREGLKVDETA